MHLISALGILIAVVLTSASSNHDPDRMKRGVIDKANELYNKAKDKARGMAQEAEDKLIELKDGAKDSLKGLINNVIKESCPTQFYPKDIGAVAPTFKIKMRKQNNRSPNQFWHKIFGPNEINDQELYEGTNTFFKKDRPVVFIVHGFLGAMSWQDEMANEILKAEDSTVVVVEWNGGSAGGTNLLTEIFGNVFTPSDIYWQARANTQTVAWAISAFAESISKSKIFRGNPNSLYLHCIGHSLGAHICGQAGRLAKQNGVGFNRVSGLDPAQPGFEHCKGINMSLDTSSAQCVDVIHTNTDYFGWKAPLGHVDFYPNCGRFQWECHTVKVRNPVCSHSRSFEFFTASIDKSNPCEALGPCAGMVDETTHRCLTQSNNRMGFYSSCHNSNVNRMGAARGVYYINTAQKPSPVEKCLDHKTVKSMVCPRVGDFTVKDKK